MTPTAPIELKSRAEIEIMRRANLIVYEVLQTLSEMVVPGATTAEINAKAAELTREKGATPAFLGYPAHSAKTPPFPGVICASINDAIVHGIPNDQPLKEGDILSIDYGCVFDGYYGDSAVTIPVGTVPDRIEKLLKLTNQSLHDAIAQCVPGNRIGDISNAVQSRVEPAGFGVVREFVGHGIGKRMHEPPAIPNFGKSGQGRVLKAGMVIAIEPMVTAGAYETKLLPDGWTAVTRDGSFAAHFEHTVAITDQGPYVLSMP